MEREHGIQAQILHSCDLTANKSARGSMHLEQGFSQANPKFAFMAWLALRDRLSTMDRVSNWSQAWTRPVCFAKMLLKQRSTFFLVHLLLMYLGNSY